jgi:protein involved in polysaccharide export with SLBB domain
MDGMKLAALLLATVLAALTLGQSAPARLKVGDLLEVDVVGFDRYNGEYRILSDGSIQGRGFGRLVVQGLTVVQAETLVRTSLSKVVRNPSVTLILKDQKQEFVYVSGAKGPNGGIELLPDMTLRQLVASVEVVGTPDLMEAKLFRSSENPRAFILSDILRGEAGLIPLRANDVLVLAEADVIRVWLTGLVAQPGEYTVRNGVDAYQALALAGGLRAQDEETVELYVRRGTQHLAVPVRPDAGTPPIALIGGDTLIVQGAEVTRVIVGGEVEKPGEYSLRDNRTLAAVIASAGGVGKDGTLRNVLVVRRGEPFLLDVSAVTQGEAGPAFRLETGDLVYVRPNEDAVVAVGTVNNPGRYLLQPHRSYRLADVLALAGGMTDRGSLRRVYVGRRGPDGRMQVKEYALDQFLKDGMAESNPEMMAGDVVLFGQPKGVSAQGILQIMSSAVLFRSVFP